MSSIYIISNCHLNGLMRSVKFFDPALTVGGCHLWDLADRFPDEDKLLSTLDEYDHIFIVPYGRHFCPAGDSDLIIRSLPHKAGYHPTVTFGAFHPDVVHIFRQPREDGFLSSALGPYNSALAYYGFRRGYDIERTIGLFRSDIFERVGYFAMWQPAVDELVQDPLAREFGFERLVLSWLRRGCFMHTPQHPKIGPLSDIARVMMQKAGFTLKHTDPLPFLPDDLQTSLIWPVFPEIGQFYGLPGEYTFRPDPIPGTWPPFMTLREFVTTSYGCYRSTDLTQFACQRVDGWLEDGLDLV